jgi:hypothetical protein
MENEHGSPVSLSSHWHHISAPLTSLVLTSTPWDYIPVGGTLQGEGDE